MGPHGPAIDAARSRSFASGWKKSIGSFRNSPGGPCWRNFARARASPRSTTRSLSSRRSWPSKSRWSNSTSTMESGPQGIVGHSIGEVAAGFAAGALTLEQAVQVIYHRSQAQNLASGQGGMLAVGLGLEEARKLIAGYDGRVSIGAVNGPEMLTLSGDSDPLGHIAETLEARGVFNRPVRVQVAYHSHHMESIKGVMLEALAHVAGSRGHDAAVLHRHRPPRKRPAPERGLLVPERAPAGSVYRRSGRDAARQLRHLCGNRSPSGAGRRRRRAVQEARHRCRDGFVHDPPGTRSDGVPPEPGATRGARTRSGHGEDVWSRSSLCPVAQISLAAQPVLVRVAGGRRDCAADGSNIPS